MNRNEAGDVIHVTDQPVEEGQTVTAAVDWDRRLDHMQQHTGVLIDLQHCTRDFPAGAVVISNCSMLQRISHPYSTLHKKRAAQLLCVTNG